jgi:hypothetical protein
MVHSIWEIEKENIPYIIPSFSHGWLEPHPIFIDNLSSRISYYLNAAVNKMEYGCPVNWIES